MREIRSERRMIFSAIMLAVSDIEKSKAFYKKYLDLDVEVDFGANVTLTGGISLQTLETWRDFIGGLDVGFRGNDAELYFETDSFDEFVNSIDGLELVHQPLEHQWGQRVVRFYDPDGHILEVGEVLSTVACRFRESGMTASEIAARMNVNEKYVFEWLNTERG